jgi:hypothetical protein
VAVLFGTDCRATASREAVYRIGGKVVCKPSFCGLEDEDDIPEKVRNRVYGEIEANGLDKQVTADWDEIIENSPPLLGDRGDRPRATD